MLASSFSLMYCSSISFSFLAISAFKSIPCLAISSSLAKFQSAAASGSLADLLSLACSGWLKRKTWFLPKMTLEPVLSVTAESTLRPLRKQMAPSVGVNVTTPSLFSKTQCSGKMCEPASWMSCGELASGLPIRVTPSLM